ncbi:MAG: transporter substrate-binding domain-containing protein [Clostridia bacterium]|nr:transporter substrate-binding domain-containing protein [Clostridia bacterium]
MKKVLSLILAVVLCLGCTFAFASCGGGETFVSKVGVQKGTTSEMYANILKGVKVASYDTFALAANDMKNGNVDFVIVDKTTANALSSQISGLKVIDNIPLSSENYGIGIDPAQTALKGQIDAILENKAAEIQAIKDKYMNDDTDAFVGVTSAAKNVDNAAGQLVVATNAEFAPWEYASGAEDGGTVYYGIDMEIAKLIADELNMELVIEDMAFDNVVGSVGKQGIDIAMSGITITAERLEVINFSNPYYTESIVVVCKADDTRFDSCGTVVDLLTIICVASEEE